MTAARRLARWVELFTIFFFLPAAVALITDPEMRVRPAFAAIDSAHLYDASRDITRFLFPILIAIGLIAALVLVIDPTFENRRLWNARAFKRDAKRIFIWFGVNALLMLVAAWALATFTDILTVTDRNGQEGSAFLRLPREMPIILLFIAVGYPWLSCYPQEVLHRAYFFHRYQPLMRTPTLIALNTLAFAWLHAAFWSIEALLLTLPGGLLFAYTYHRTKSTLAVTVEHALYGWWAFFVGLGWFVFTGSIGS